MTGARGSRLAWSSGKKAEGTKERLQTKLRPFYSQREREEEKRGEEETGAVMLILLPRNGRGELEEPISRREKFRR